MPHSFFPSIPKFLIANSPIIMISFLVTVTIQFLFFPKTKSTRVDIAHYANEDVMKISRLGSQNLSFEMKKQKAEEEEEEEAAAVKGE